MHKSKQHEWTTMFAMTATKGATGVVAVALFLSGCSAPPPTSAPAVTATNVVKFAPGPPKLPDNPQTAWRRIPSTIVALNYQGQEMVPGPAIEHLPRVTAGAPLKVTIRSFGGGCEEAGGVDGTVDGLEVELRPWDYTHSPDPDSGVEYMCTQPLKIFTRTADVVLREPGIATLRVHGVASHGRKPSEPTIVTSSVRVD